MHIHGEAVGADSLLPVKSMFVIMNPMHPGLSEESEWTGGSSSKLSSAC